MEIVCKKPTGKKKVDSRLVLAVKSKKKKHGKITAPSLKALRSDSNFLSSNRLTSRIGLFCKGKSSTRVKRLSEDSPLMRARAEQNLQKVLEIASKQNGKHNERSCGCSPVAAMSKNRRTISPHTEGLYRESSPTRNNEMQRSHLQSEECRSSSSSEHFSGQSVSKSRILNLLFCSVTGQLKREVEKSCLSYWDRARYLRMKKILSPEPSTGTPSSSLLLESSAKRNSPVSICSTMSAEDSTDNFVLNICPELKRTVPSASHMNVLNCNEVQHLVDRKTSKQDILDPNGIEPSRTQLLERLLGFDILAWEPEMTSAHECDHFRPNIDQFNESASKLPLLVKGDSLPKDLSPIKPPSDAVETPKLFFRRKMF